VEGEAEDEVERTECGGEEEKEHDGDLMKGAANARSKGW
jgi:hypothetical protein